MSVGRRINNSYNVIYQLTPGATTESWGILWEGLQDWFLHALMRSPWLGYKLCGPLFSLLYSQDALQAA